MKSLEQQLKVLEDYEEKISDIITLVEHDYTIHLQSKDIISFKTSQEYIEISKNGKIGLMNSDCKILIQPSFDAILSYNHENRTLVFEMRHWDKQLERKEGVANFKGDILLQPKYDRILYYDSTLYVVLLNGQYGIIDKEGRTLVDFGRFDYIDTFVDGLARTKKNNRWGIINANGEVVIKNLFEDMWKLRNGYRTTRAIYNGEDFYINLPACREIDPLYDRICYYKNNKYKQNAYPELRIDIKADLYALEQERLKEDDNFYISPLEAFDGDESLYNDWLLNS